MTNMQDISPQMYYHPIPYRLWFKLKRKLSCTVMDKIFRHSMRRANLNHKTESCESFFREHNSEVYHEIMNLRNSVYAYHLSYLEEIIETRSQSEISTKIRLTLKLLKICSELNIIPPWSTAYMENRSSEAACFYVAHNMICEAIDALRGLPRQRKDCERFFYSAYERSTTNDESGQRNPKRCHVEYFMIHSWENTYLIGGEWGVESREGHYGFLPVFSAVRYGHPEAVLGLLQNGFSPRFGFTRSLYPQEDHLFLNLIFWMESPSIARIRSLPEITEPIKMVFTVTVWIYDLLMKSAINAEVLRIPEVPTPDVQRLCDSLRIVWKAVCFHYVRKSDLYLAANAVQSNEGREQIIPGAEELCEIYETFLFDMELESHHPRTLKHQCKMLIRQILHEKDLIPEGIHMLGVPDLICRILNLEID